MAATMNEKMTPDPASCADAAAVRTNRPAPMTAPMPRAIRLFAVSVLFRVLWLARSSSDSRDFLRVRLIGIPIDYQTRQASGPTCGARGAPWALACSVHTPVNATSFTASPMQCGTGLPACRRLTYAAPGALQGNLATGLTRTCPCAPCATE